MNKCRTLFASICCLLLVSAALAGPVPTLKAVKTSQPPQIDGKLTDPCWQEAAQADKFTLLPGGAPQAQTTAYLLYDDAAIYIAMKCQEPQMDAIKARATQRDQGVVGDDCVEIFIQPDETVLTYYHFGLNSKAVQFDQSSIMGNSWNPEWQAGASAGSDWWAVEMVIPMKILGVEAQMGRVWRINFCRNKQTDPQELSTWSPVEGAGGFHSPDRFARLEGIVVEGLSARGSDLGLKEIALGEAKPGESQLTAKFQNRNDKDRELEVRAKAKSPSGKESVTSAQLAIKAKSDASIKLPYQLAVEEGEHWLVLEAIENGQKVYSSPPATLRVPTFIKLSLDRSYYTSEEMVELTIRSQVEMPAAAGYSYRNRLVKASEGNTVAETQASSFQGGLGRIGTSTVSLKQLPVGEYQWIVEVLDRQGKPVASAAANFHKLAPARNEVKIVRAGKDSHILVEGKPFFPIGIYGAPPEGFAELAKAGFNMVIRWKTGDPRAYFDAAWAQGLRVIDSLIFYGTGVIRYADPRWEENMQKNRLPAWEAVVNQTKDHPALLAWYNLDEPPLKYARYAQQVYDLVHRNDPYHPVIMYQPNPRAWSNPEIANTTDIMTTGVYMSYGVPLSRLVWETDMTMAAAAEADKPGMAIPCAGRFSGSEREYTPGEQRSQSYLCLIHGGRGIIWFIYRPMYSGLWEELKRVTGEIKQLSPILLSPTPEQTVKIEPEDSPVHILLKQYGGKTYLITANSRHLPTQVTFRLPGLLEGKKIKVVFENREVKSGKEQFSDSFSGYASHVYEIP